jgi:hypothetical protein
MKTSRKTIKIAEQDIVFLSYDEQNAEKNYADLRRKIPWAKRVHGVDGSDAAHKACAEISDTKHFITVDGDTIVHPEFLNVELDLDALGLNEDYQFSWCGNININNLKYGNGSLKMWTKDFVQNMKTHENTDGSDETQIEFCYFNNYFQLNENYSTSIINSTPAQAWRAGFREGVKMSLHRGKKIQDVNKDIWWKNLHRLLIWMNVGTDVEHGWWSCFGARQGSYLTLCTDWDVAQTRDFKALNKLWNQNNSEQDIHNLMKKYSEALITKGVNIGLEPLESQQSKFFKQVYVNNTRRFK